MIIRIIESSVIKSFSAKLRADERSAATIEKYVSDIREFTVWQNGAEVTKECTTGWKEHLLNLGRKASTVNRKLAALNQFLKFVGWDDCQVKLLRLQKRVFREKSRDLTKPEYERLVHTAKMEGKTRTGLILQTICATGIRVSELQFITVEAINKQKAEISLKGKIRTILLSKSLCDKLKRFAKNRHIVSGPVFLSRNGAPLSRGTVWAEMKALCKKAGIEASKVFPHNLRHLFATVFYRVTHDIVKLADLLGHSSINTTRIYLISTSDEHVRELEKLNLVLSTE